MHSRRGEPRLEHCTFTNNKAEYQGGGIDIHLRSPAVINNCTFGNNTAGDAGAIAIHGGNLTLTECVFSENVAETHGGAVALSGPGSYILTNCKFLGNCARQGGGIFSDGGQSDLTKLGLTNCTFSGNKALSHGGAISNRSGCMPILINCTFTGNKAHQAGSVIYHHDSKLTLASCVLWENITKGKADESAQIHADPANSTAVLNYCCIQGWSGKLGGVGNFGDDPLFIDPDGDDDKIGTEDDDLRLNPDSPCINRGDNTALPADTSDLDKDGDTAEPMPFDIEGNPRIHSGTVDIGAYEVK